MTAATILALVLAALATAPPASAAKGKSCARAIIDDWFGDFRIDKIYPEHCYRDAIKALPVDVRDYSSAKEDILRALAYAQQGKPDPGDQSGSGGGTNAGGTNGGGGGIGPGSNGGGPGSGSGGSSNQTTGVDTSGPSSVPIPLIVLAGLATLLLALGAAGYLTRRMTARRAADEPPVDEPPVGA